MSTKVKLNLCGVLALSLIGGVPQSSALTVVRFLPTPAEFPVTGPISIIDAKHVWVGLNHTSDGGRTWTAWLPNGRDASRFYDLPSYGQTTTFVSDTQGWLTGMDAVWLTVDGGQSWQPQIPGRIRSAFFSGHNGWMAVTSTERTGNHVSNYVTTDLGKEWTTCGETWQPVSVAPLGAASFIDKQKGWITVANFDQLERPYRRGVARTVDGGCTWKVIWWDQSTESENFDGIRFIDANSGWLFSSHGHLLTTSDGGLQWAIVPLPRHARNLESAYLAAADQGWVLGGSVDGPSLFFTADGGQQWEEVSIDATKNDGANTQRPIPKSWGAIFLTRGWRTKRDAIPQEY